MGGSKTVVQSAQPAPTQPTYGGTYADYAANYPKLVELERQYGPELAQLDYNLFQQYAPQYSQIAEDINQQLYPQTAALQENLASQALAGMNEPLPQEFRDQYTSDFNAGLGMNVNAPLGVSERNIGLARLQKEWGDYYRNLGLSVANRQPLAQPSNPTFRNPNEGFDNALGFASQNYGTAGNIYANSLYGSRQSGVGSKIGSSLMGGGAMSMMALSNPATAPFALGAGLLGGAGGYFS